MSDDPLSSLAEEREKKIADWEAVRALPEYKTQERRLTELTQGFTVGIGITYLIASRSQPLVETYLTFRFIHDTLQTAVAVLTLATNGLLNPAKRELRYILESSAKHLHVDLQCPTLPLAEKLDVLEFQLPRSSVDFVGDMRLVALGDDEKDFKDSIRSYFGRLSRYVHRSAEQIREDLALLKRGVSPGFETANEFERFNRDCSSVYDLVMVMHLQALDPALAGDAFTAALDQAPHWPFHRTKFVRKVSQFFDYKHERQREHGDC